MSIFRVLFLSSVVVLVAACGPKVDKRPCMKMGSSDPLVVDAVMFRLDVYGGGVACAGAGAGVAANSNAPVMSHTYEKGQPIALDVPPGAYTLVLTTYSDMAAQHLLGRGCTTTTLSAGAQICFDLTLAPATGAGGDGGCSVSPDNCPAGEYCDGTRCVQGCSVSAQCTATDDAGAASELCCGGGCTNIESSVDNCGGCGMACSTSHVARHCSVGSCDGNCLAGYADCNNDKRSDGCEAALDSIDNCGSCGSACDTTRSVGASCTSSGCAYTSCNSGFIDCNKTAPNSDGCECATATTPAEGTAGCCANGCQTQHDNALGQSFYDCNPPKTYTEDEATTACTAYAIAQGGTAKNCTWYTCSGNNSGSNPAIICSDALGTSMFPCYCWGFAGTAQGHALNGCYCPASGDPTWN
jgi:hypothetical protein